MPALAAPEAPHHSVPLATSPIAVDGLLDESAWSTALELELNYEVQPGENIEPPVRTVCLVTYDADTIFFAFRAYDPDPGDIRARLSDRDRAWDDDWVGIVLDTFNDQRRAYELLSNPLGVQIDAINDDVQQRYDDSWNAIWKSAGQINADGYTVEMAIPFNQIRFQPGEGVQTWGFDAIRSYPRNDRHHIGLFARDRGATSYLAQTEKLVGMDGASPGRNLELIPTFTASRSDGRDPEVGGPLEELDSTEDLGLSLRWGITPNISLNSAVNPDFSQVEADAVQLDINEQFALFFQETRPFFLEGADYFSTNLNLVHTRTIADPNAAGKLTGKQGHHTFALFSAEDDVTQMVFPGTEGSSGGSYDIQTLGTVGRYRYDIGKSSMVGATITDRRGDGYSNTVIGIDTVYRPTDADQINISLAGSQTEYNQEMINTAGVQSGSFSDQAINVEYNHSVRDWWIWAGYDDFGDGFRSDLGFRPRVGLRELDVRSARVWWGEDDDFFNRTALGAGGGRSETQDGNLQSEEVVTWLNLDGPHQSYASINLEFGNRAFEQTLFEDLWSGSFYFKMQATGNFSWSFNLYGGDHIDFTHAVAADRLVMRPSVNYKFGRHLSMSYNHTYSELNVEQGELFTVHAPEARVVYQFNSRILLRMILQYQQVEWDNTLFGDTGDTEMDDLFAQLLFSYKINPNTALYLGYTDGYQGTQDYGLIETDRTFFTKLSYAWVP
jgi:hypothetical protein